MPNSGSADPLCSALVGRSLPTADATPAPDRADRGELRYRAVMRGLLLVVLLATPALAGDADRTVRENPFNRGQYDVYDGDGARVGTVRENPFTDGQYDVYDRAGQRTETVRENPFKADSYDVTRDGQRTGTVERNPFDADRYDLRDPAGRTTGTLREDPFESGTYDLDRPR